MGVVLVVTSVALGCATIWAVLSSVLHDRVRLMAAGGGVTRRWP